MKLENFSNDLRELSILECNEINGGESAWYWLALGVGAGVRAVKDVTDSIGASTGWW